MLRKCYNYEFEECLSICKSNGLDRCVAYLFFKIGMNQSGIMVISQTFRQEYTTLLNCRYKRSRVAQLKRRT